MRKKLYVFERADGTRFCMQFASSEEADQYATDNDVTRVR